MKAALAKVPGVNAAEMTVGTKWVFLSDYVDARALVTYARETVAVDLLVKVVETTSNPLSECKACVLTK
ncbi:MAG: hypothetical protein MRJ68_19640 [Nitrospira sp.]|nr:hypothetical protein [Nitrospira sp.]